MLSNLAHAARADADPEDETAIDLSNSPVDRPEEILEYVPDAVVPATAVEELEAGVEAGHEFLEDVSEVVEESVDVVDVSETAADGTFADIPKVDPGEQRVLELALDRGGTAFTDDRRARDVAAGDQDAGVDIPVDPEGEAPVVPYSGTVGLIADAERANVLDREAANEMIDTLGFDFVESLDQAQEATKNKRGIVSRLVETAAVDLTPRGSHDESSVEVD